MTFDIDWQGVRTGERLEGAVIKKLSQTIARKIKKAKNRNFAVSFISETKMAKLNLSYRGKNKSTDVLSFGPDSREKFPHEDSNHGGDIVLCLPYLKRQAKQVKVPLKEELARMLVHGVMHCLGYDHETHREAQMMFPLQEEIVKNIFSPT